MSSLPSPPTDRRALAEHLLGRRAQILAARRDPATGSPAVTAGTGSVGPGDGDLEVIRASLFFDPDWYLATYPDVAAAGLDAAEHYLGEGAAEKRDPGPWFSTQRYLDDHPDVAAAGFHPLVHFERYGRAEGRPLPWSSHLPGPATTAVVPATASVDDDLSILARSIFFDARWYLDRYPDVRAAGLEPALHYYQWGAAEGHDPGPYFSTRRYLRDNDDVAATHTNALVHFERYGRTEGRWLPWPDGATLAPAASDAGGASGVDGGQSLSRQPPGGGPDRVTAGDPAAVAGPAGSAVAADPGLAPGGRLSVGAVAAIPPRQGSPWRVHSTNGPVEVFLAGVQKGGTSTLHRYLTTHPGLNAPRKKELHFFDDETRGWHNPDYDEYHGCFAAGRLEQPRFDATPSYSFWAPALDRIWRYNPGARFILVFRDPVSRAVSHWRMERSYGYEPLSFGAAIRAEPERLAAAPRWSRDWRELSYVARGRYGECLARLLSRFPRSQVLLLRSVDLFRDHQAVLAAIAAFLGLEPFGPTDPVHAFRGVNQESVAPADVEYVRHLLRDDMACFAALSGLDISAWLAPACTAR
jgi:hypothetical protein